MRPDQTIAYTWYIHHLWNTTMTGKFGEKQFYTNQVFEI